MLPAISGGFNWRVLQALRHPSGHPLQASLRASRSWHEALGALSGSAGREVRNERLPAREQLMHKTPSALGILQRFCKTPAAWSAFADVCRKRMPARAAAKASCPNRLARIIGRERRLLAQDQEPGGAGHEA